MSGLAHLNKRTCEVMGGFLVWYYSAPLLPESCKSGTKPNAETVLEIKKIKEFLAANASWFHQMARQKDVRSELNEHLNLVNQLYSMRKAVGEVSFEK